MSIEALLQAAEYLDRKERGKAIFLADIYNNLDAKKFYHNQSSYNWLFGNLRSQRYTYQALKNLRCNKGVNAVQISCVATCTYVGQIKCSHADFLIATRPSLSQCHMSCQNHLRLECSRVCAKAFRILMKFILAGFGPQRKLVLKLIITRLWGVPSWKWRVTYISSQCTIILKLTCNHIKMLTLSTSADFLLRFELIDFDVAWMHIWHFFCSFQLRTYSLTVNVKTSDFLSWSPYICRILLKLFQPCLKISKSYLAWL